MFFVGDFQQRKPRRMLENRWSKLNILFFVIQAAAFAYGCYDLSDRLTSTVSSYGGSTMTIVADGNYDAIQKWCEVNATNPNHHFPISREGMRYELYVKSGYSLVLWARHLDSFMTSLVFAGVTLLFSLINKIWFEVGYHAIRIYSVLIHQNITVTAELISTVLTVVYLVDATRQASYVKEWLSKCSEEYGDIDSSLNSVPDIPVIFSVALGAAFQCLMYVMYAFYGAKSCHLDVEVKSIEVGPDGEERPKIGRLHSLVINGKPVKRDGAYVEALVKHLKDGDGLAAMAMSRAQVVQYVKEEEERAMLSASLVSTPPFSVASAPNRNGTENPNSINTTAGMLGQSNTYKGIPQRPRFYPSRQPTPVPTTPPRSIIHNSSKFNAFDGGNGGDNGPAMANKGGGLLLPFHDDVSMTTATIPSLSQMALMKGSQHVSLAGVPPGAGAGFGGPQYPTSLPITPLPPPLSSMHTQVHFQGGGQQQQQQQHDPSSRGAGAPMSVGFAVDGFRRPRSPSPPIVATAAPYGTIGRTASPPLSNTMGGGGQFYAPPPPPPPQPPSPLLAGGIGPADDVDRMRGGYVIDFGQPLGPATDHPANSPHYMGSTGAVRAPSYGQQGVGRRRVPPPPPAYF